MSQNFLLKMTDVKDLTFSKECLLIFLQKFDQSHNKKKISD